MQEELNLHAMWAVRQGFNQKLEVLMPLMETVDHIANAVQFRSNQVSDLIERTEAYERAIKDHRAKAVKTERLNKKVDSLAPELDELNGAAAVLTSNCTESNKVKMKIFLRKLMRLPFRVNFRNFLIVMWQPCTACRPNQVRCPALYVVSQSKQAKHLWEK